MRYLLKEAEKHREAAETGSHREVLWASESGCGVRGRPTRIVCCKARHLGQTGMVAGHGALCLFAKGKMKCSRQAGRLLAKQGGGGCEKQGGGKKQLKEELGRRMYPQGNFSQPAVWQHSHCMTVAIMPLYPCYMPWLARGPQHTQPHPSTGRQQWASATGKHRGGDIRTPEQMGDHACSEAVEIPQPLEDGGVVGTEGIVWGHQMSVHDVLLQPKACFPSDIFWQQSVLKWVEVSVTFWKNTTIFSCCLERCGWR